MDRVLLILDDIQYNRQLEMALRKVGFDVESINNEFNVNEPLLSFNPDYIIVRGNSSRLNVLNVGKKLKESSNNGKIILVFPENTNLVSDDLFKIKADLVLTDPISTIRLVLYLVSISELNAEMIKEKLMKFAVTDAQFRQNEQLILKNAGISVDAEIELLSNMEELPEAAPEVKIFGSEKKKDQGVIVFKDEKPKSDTPGTMVFKDEKPKKSNLVILKEDVDGEPSGASVNGDTIDEEVTYITDDLKAKISQEIQLAKGELPLRIDTYNRVIKDVDQDLKCGHKKRQTKKEFNQLHKDLLNENKTDKKTEQELDEERIRFTKALFKPK